ncbi:MAG: hypothetical protein AAGD25_17960 [Cyanobacteria bacterium P01_F01_bin.150]
MNSSQQILIASAESENGASNSETVLIEQNGGDELLGNNGEATIVGKQGDELLNGEANQTIPGGIQGADSFILPEAGFTELMDFGGGDRINFNSSNLQFENLGIAQVRGNTIMETDCEILALLRGVRASTIAESSFI